LLRGTGLVKTTRFAKPRYLGDAINAVRIFNDKLADELVILDIDKSRQGRPPDFDLVRAIASEAFMPICYGGGVKTLDDMERILLSGAEKVLVNTALFGDPGLVSQAARQFGSQSLIAGIDVRRDGQGRYQVWSRSGLLPTGLDPVLHARGLAESGVGEIVLQSIDRDGTMAGYDCDLVEAVVRAVDVPVVALGGAGSTSDLAQVLVESGAAAAAAGSLFVYIGRLRAVLINMPTAEGISDAIQRVARGN
jgi:cyclase